MTRGGECSSPGIVVVVKTAAVLHKNTMDFVQANGIQPGGRPCFMTGKGRAVALTL